MRPRPPAAPWGRSVEVDRGLALKAQHAAIALFAESEGFAVTEECIEAESGKLGPLSSWRHSPLAHVDRRLHFFIKQPAPLAHLGPL
jgi:hypothetical protein